MKLKILKRLHRRSMTSRFDGVYVGHAGVQYEAFDPRWWQVWRWLGWWTSRRAKGYVTFETQMLEGTILSRRVRVREVLPRPRARIEDQFKRPPIT